MSDQPENNSMWLQESITVPDPLPEMSQRESPAVAAKSKSPTPSIVAVMEDNEKTPVRQETKKTEFMSALPTPRVLSEAPFSSQKEVELTKMAFDPTSLAASVQRANSSMRFSSARPPVMTGSSLVSAQEYDDLRLRYSKAKRELIRLSDIHKDLEYSRFELSKSQEEVKVIRDSYNKMKSELEEAVHRADQDRRVKVALEIKMADNVAQHEKEMEFLRRQLDDLREENAQRLQELNEQQETEAQLRIEAMRAELSGLGMQMDTLAAQLDDVTAQKSEVEEEMKTVAVELKNANLSIAELEKKLQTSNDNCRELERQHREYASQAEKHLEEQIQLQKKLHDDHVQQVLSSKDSMIAELKEELEVFGTKRRELEDELATLRHKNQQLQEEMAQVSAKHEKAIRRLTEDHQLAMSEKQLALEEAVREAKGGRSAMDEENQSLQRQVAKVTEELATVSSILAQREKQINVLEKDNGRLREVVSSKEQEVSQLNQQLDVNTTSISEMSERVSRLMAEKEAMEEGFEYDAKEYKSRNRELEANIMECRKELLTARTQLVAKEDEFRSTITELNSKNNDLTAECGALRLTVKQLRNGESEVEEVRRQLFKEKSISENLRAELSAAISRYQLLEEQQHGTRVREIVQRTSRSPFPLHRQPASLRTANPNIPRAGSKRERPEDARVVAISGLDASKLMESIKRLPNVAMADCKSNMPVPSNLTHLITNGQLTLKLLSSLVKGCWVLPERYILDSLQRKEWLPEEDYGFQHDVLPLQNRKIFMTPAFVASRNFNTANIIIKEGSATVVDREEEADMVLCTSSENDKKERMSRDGPVMTWDCFIETIYPQKITG